MKISTLLKREKFYQILSNTLLNFKPVHSDTMPYYVYKKLNIVCTKDIDRKLFEDLVGEYRYSQNFVKTKVQRIYIKIISMRFARYLNFFETIDLPIVFRHDAILGGNHRVRIFKSGMGSNTVVLKNGEFDRFIENDVNLREKLQPTYAPQIIERNSYWYTENNVKGIPANRLALSIQHSVASRLSLMHFQEVIAPSLVFMSADEYLKMINNSLIDLLRLKDKKLILFIHEFLALSECLLSRHSETIPVASTHGDCQMGNVRVDDERIYLLDWEASEKRYACYDLFVLNGYIRSSNVFSEAYSNYSSHKMLEYPRVNQKLDFLLLLIEEIRFNLLEQNSANYQGISRVLLDLYELLKKESGNDE